MIAKESMEDPLMYNLCMAITNTDIIRVKYANLLDTDTTNYLSDLEKNLAEIKDYLLNLILNKNLQMMN
jgi:hypothetical protein